MNNYFTLCFVLLMAMYVACTDSSGKYPYQDASLSIEKRVNDLTGRMALEEKVFQLQSQMKFMHEYKDRDFRVGNVRNIGHFMHKDANEPIQASASAEAINADTRKSVEANRWGIPVLQHGEALHGAQWGNATCFPQSIGMAAAFDDEFYFKAGQAVTTELRAVGIRQVLAPVVNISRDPRWGRTEESYGEDVFLCSRMGVAYTKALEQGGVIATPKHFADNYGDAGHDSYASNNSWRVLRETFLEPFRACFVEGGARSVMAAYNSIDGVPCHANKVLLNDILRGEWGFNGFVVSDYSGVNGVYKAHRLADSYPEAQAQCLEAGLDVDLPRGNIDLLDLVKNGRISEKQIDQSLRRVLTCKFELGLFDQPYVDAEKANEVVRCPEHKKLALEAARRVMTLLKNKEGLLPLSDSTIKRIGLFGPAANVLSLGDYSGPYGGWKGADAPTPFQALTERLKGKAEVVLHDPQTDAASLAKTCDVVVFFGSIREGEGHDRSLLALPSKPVKAAKSLDNAMIVEDAENPVINLDQEEMIAGLAASGTKTIVVLQNGSTIDIRNWIGNVDALLEAWYPGEQGAVAIAETLFGNNNPGGRLPFTWARHAGQLPIYYDIKPSGRGYAYNDDDGKPMFPFGFGLSYTSFEYSNLVVPLDVKNGETIEVRFTLKNTGKVKGDEVVQLYLHDVIASVVRPMRELKAFKRVTLEAGECREIVLELPYRSFCFWNRNLEFVSEPGEFKLFVGRNAADTRLEGSVQVL
ncbi:MAG: glycoside hydrolase family 3 N-terminal domain-containing protein [Mangrovibacterium sp.]|nr:glycoside hydrolase family 3 N-terminal domain-containing protein [Mangrovibacterium sp.]